MRSMSEIILYTTYIQCATQLQNFTCIYIYIEPEMCVTHMCNSHVIHILLYMCELVRIISNMYLYTGKLLLQKQTIEQSVV